MPVIDGQYRLPKEWSRGLPGPVSCAYLRLRNHLWNVLAYEYDEDRDNTALWQKKAARSANVIRAMFDERFGEEESERAIAFAWTNANLIFAEDLANEGKTKPSFADLPGAGSRTDATPRPVYRFREQRGRDPGFM
jgi:hypothetical protein